MILTNTDDDSEIAKGKGPAPGSEVKVRIRIRDNKLDFSVDGKTVLSGGLPVKKGASPNLGPFRWEVKKGEAVFAAPFHVEGQLRASELRKRFAEVEILVRRAAVACQRQL